MQYYDEIFRFAYYMTGSEDAACDCTQETFLRLIRFYDTYVEKRKFKAWLFRIARNVCYDYFRRQKEVPSEDVTLGRMPDKAETDRNLRHLERGQVIRAALEKLPRMQRDVVILRFYHELSIKEIAIITDSKIPTVKSRLRQSIGKLRHLLNEEELI
ncbi:RNA polymerase sigma factor [Lachnospiraceae bacterium]|uniref:RNA polymerase sigma factor n=1 Tax=Extibacter sp. GGCC_0201 TaxID=2731209 RepID=UPI001AA121C3|nr:RNA polymerase sigma factor [Extibacter sp. GGCC_0201]MBO1719597.1 RNA polymerase sigma factor [Extibacter sp. GGCC_0201]BDF33908.1 RNA polymerase sigma factor [Lachnospiraceae bacterium]BDF37912.1 RNA polymerase sigma factor [Lachnospiraceae bacterium]